MFRSSSAKGRRHRSWAISLMYFFEGIREGVLLVSWDLKWHFNARNVETLAQCMSMLVWIQSFNSCTFSEVCTAVHPMPRVKKRFNFTSSQGVDRSHPGATSALTLSSTCSSERQLWIGGSHVQHKSFRNNPWIQHNWCIYLYIYIYMYTYIVHIYIYIYIVHICSIHIYIIYLYTYINNQ